MDTKRENIARPGHRPQVDDPVWVVPVSEKRAQGHYGHNEKLIFEKAKTPTTNTNTPFTTMYPKFPKFPKFHRVRQMALGLLQNQNTKNTQSKPTSNIMDTKGENITRPGHRPQVGDPVWVVPVSEKRAQGHYGHDGK